MPTFKEDLHLGHSVPTIDTEDIEDRAITEKKMADGSVSTRTIQNGAVTEPKIANRAVTEPKLADWAVSTRTVRDKAISERKLADLSVSTRAMQDKSVTNSKIADSTISMGKLDNDVQTKIQQGTQRAWAPKGNYSAETVYNVNDLVYYPDTNSSYISLQANNQGHSPVWQSATGGWWMMVLDGSYLNVMVEELEQAIAQAIEDAQGDISELISDSQATIDAAVSGANSAAQAANTAAANAEAKIDWVEEQVDSLTAYEVATALDETSIIPVQNKVVTQAINNLSENLQDVEEEMFDATHVIKDNIFDWDVAGLPTTNNNSYITPSRTEDGARWTIKTIAPTTNRNGAVKLPSLILGKTYCVKLAYNNTLTANVEVTLCKYDSGTAPGDVNISYVRRNLAIIPQESSGEITFTFKYDITTIQYLAFIFVQPVRNQYLDISNLIISECKSLDDLDIVDDSNAESDLDITDKQDNILARFYNGHIKTKNFDSSEWINLTSKFKGKKFAIVGDSISTYDGWLPSSKSGYSGSTYATYYPHTGGDVQSATQIWWYKLLVKLGITPLKWNNINVVSWSGSTVCGDSTSVTNAKPACSNKRIADIGINGFTPDIIIVFISCNDWGLDYALGTWQVSDAIPTEGNITQARSAYALMLHKIHTTYPKARVFCCTILDDIKRDRETGWPSNNNNGVTTYQWNQNIKEIAEAFGCDIIDMHACGINYQNIASLVVDEGLHPNDEGHTMMAEKVFAELIAKY